MKFFAILLMVSSELLGMAAGQLKNRFKLVGAIVSSKKKNNANVAVVLDKKKRKSLFLKEGQLVVKNPPMWIAKIEAKIIWISDGKQIIGLKTEAFAKPEGNRDDIAKEPVESNKDNLGNLPTDRMYGEFQGVDNISRLESNPNVW